MDSEILLSVSHLSSFLICFCDSSCRAGSPMLHRFATNCYQHNVESRASFGPSNLIYRMDACIDSCRFDHHYHVPAFLGLTDACRSNPSVSIADKCIICIILSQEFRIFNHLLILRSLPHTQPLLPATVSSQFSYVGESSTFFITWQNNNHARSMQKTRSARHTHA